MRMTGPPRHHDRRCHRARCRRRERAARRGHRQDRSPMPRCWTRGQSWASCGGAGPGFDGVMRVNVTGTAFLACLAKVMAHGRHHICGRAACWSQRLRWPRSTALRSRTVDRMRLLRRLDAVPWSRSRQVALGHGGRGADIRARGMVDDVPRPGASATPPSPPRSACTSLTARYGTAMSSPPMADFRVSHLPTSKWVLRHMV